MNRRLTRELRAADLLPYALGYSAIFFVCMLMGRAAPALIVGGVVLVGATLELCAMFAALGPASYWRRATLALTLGGLVAIGGTVGIALWAYEQSPFTEIILFSVPIALIYWCLAQLPCLLLRFVWMWRVGRFPESHRMGIIDIFIFTTIVAIALGSAQGAAAIYPEENPLWQTLPMLVIAVAGTHLLLTLPLTYILLGLGKEQSVGRAMGYVAVLAGFVFLFLITTRAPPQAAFFLGMMLAAYACLFGLPLAMLREKGIRLWTASTIASLKKDDVAEDVKPGQESQTAFRSDAADTRGVVTTSPLDE